MQISPCVGKGLPQRDQSKGNELEQKAGCPPPVAQAQPLDRLVHASFSIHFLIKL